MRFPTFAPTLAFVLLSGASAHALDFRAYDTTGQAPSASTMTKGQIEINRADRRLIFKNVDGSLGYGSLLNATTAGRQAVEQGAAGGLTVQPMAAGAVTALNTRLQRQPVISDFGAAAGDGSDATAAFAAAMTTGGSPQAQIPAGVYGITGCPTFTASSSVSLIGAGAGKTVIKLLTPNAVCTADIFQWVARPNVQVRNLTIDLNGATVSSGGVGVSPVNILGGSGSVVSGVEIKGAVGANWLLIGINGGTGGRVTDNTVTLTGCPTQSNQGINLSHSFGPLTGWEVSRNTLVGTGLASDATGRVSITDNDISGVCYGGSIFVAQSTTPTYAEIHRNFIHDSGTAVDVNNTLPNGIENWSPGSSVTGNRIVNVAASCVFMGGQNSVLTGNSCTKWSTAGAFGGYAAYTLQFLTSTYNANGTRVGPNASIFDGSSNSKYGLRDTQYLQGAVVSGGNYGAGVAPYQIVAGTRVIDPGALTTVANLGACGSGNLGSQMTVTDATGNARGATVAGGGATVALVVCDTASWKVY